MIEAVPFDNLSAMAVLSRLDANDLVEARLTRGGADHLDIFADWRAVDKMSLLSLVLKDSRRGGEPFAVLILCPTGQAGVAQAAMLARNHLIFRRPLAEAALRIRRDMAPFCAQWGVNRVEARCMRDHPTAAAFLRGCGFRREADLPGFGLGGRDVFVQFAWLLPNHMRS